MYILLLQDTDATLVKKDDPEDHIRKRMIHILSTSKLAIASTIIVRIPLVQEKNPQFRIADHGLDVSCVYGTPRASRLCQNERLQSLNTTVQLVNAYISRNPITSSCGDFGIL